MSLTLQTIQDAQAKLRRALGAPLMVVCHPDDLDELNTAMEWALSLGTVVHATRHVEQEAVYWIQEPEAREQKPW